MMLAIFLLLAVAFLGWMSFVEPRWFDLSRHEIFIRKKLKRPIRILHLSDTHFSGRNKPLARFFDRLAHESVDLVVVSGGIMDCDEGIHECLDNLAKLHPRYGIYAVFGNHDYYDYRTWDSILHNFPGQSFPITKNLIDLFITELEKIGVRVLRNKTLELDIDGTPILIHGMDDPTTGHANIRRTLENFDPAKLNLLLTHTVDVFLDIGDNEIDVSFSGHSHGGQIRLPFIGPIITHTRLGRRFASGLCQIQGATCCISRGMSANRYARIRFLCRPEAVLLTLCS